MKVGVNLINFGPGASPSALQSWVRTAEGLGYHFLMTSDHVALTPDVTKRYPAPFYEPWTTLGWLASETKTMEIGTTVIIVPYRHPLETARFVATVDRFSGGRFIFGIGVGWAAQEFAALGVPFARRGAMTDDYLAAMKAYWASDVASYEGPFVSFRNVDTRPRPVAAPHPPVWVGGGSDAAIRRAARHGDAWHPIRIRLDVMRDQGLPKLRAFADKEGKRVPAFCPRIRLRLTDAAMPDGERVCGEGTVDQVRRDFAELETLGAQYVLLDTYADDIEATRRHETAWRMIATIAERVVDLPRQSLR
jgi:probable F420-dependent oxidoreductase